MQVEKKPRESVKMFEDEKVISIPSLVLHCLRVIEHNFPFFESFSGLADHFQLHLFKFGASMNILNKEFLSKFDLKAVSKYVCICVISSASNDWTFSWNHKRWISRT